MISGIPQSRIPSFSTVNRNAPKAPVAETVTAHHEDPTQAQFDSVWQSKAKLQQALRVYQGMDESEVMQDVN